VTKTFNAAAVLGGAVSGNFISARSGAIPSFSMPGSSSRLGRIAWQILT
jgi:hypothetical protein